MLKLQYLLLVPAILAVLALCGGIDIHYQHYVNNNAFSPPYIYLDPGQSIVLKSITVDAHALTISDGKDTYPIFGASFSLSTLERQSGSIPAAFVVGGGRTHVYISRPTTRCGTIQGLFRIPLIPTNIPANTPIDICAIDPPAARPN